MKVTKFGIVDLATPCRVFLSGFNTDESDPTLGDIDLARMIVKQFYEEAVRRLDYMAAELVADDDKIPMAGNTTTH